MGMDKLLLSLVSNRKVTVKIFGTILQASTGRQVIYEL